MSNFCYSKIRNKLFCDYTYVILLKNRFAEVKIDYKSLKYYDNED